MENKIEMVEEKKETFKEKIAKNKNKIIRRVLIGIAAVGTVAAGAAYLAKVTNESEEDSDDLTSEDPIGEPIEPISEEKTEK